MKEYYWVRHYFGSNWQVALLNEEGHWRLAENPYVLDRGDFVEIGEKIEPPKTKNGFKFQGEE